MRDIIALSCDSAQRAAQAQLKQTLESAGHSNAYCLIDLTPSSEHLDFSDANILQPSHLEALVDIKQFKNTLSASRSAKNAHTSGAPSGKGGGGKGGGRGRASGFSGGKGCGGYGKGGFGKGKWVKGSESSSPGPVSMDP